MNKQKISFKVPQVKHRNHFALFAEDSPFKPKKVERKDGYQRKPKHNKPVEWF